MKKIIIPLILLICNISFSQKTITVEGWNNIKESAENMESDSLILKGTNYSFRAFFPEESEIMNKVVIIYFTETINRKYKLEYSYLYRGSAKYNLNDFIGAIKDFNEQIVLNPKDSKAHQMRALSKIGLEDYYGGIIDLSKAINNFNKESGKSYLSSLFNERARCYLLLKKDPKALIDLNKAIELDNENSLSYELRGLYYLYNKFKEKACLDWSKSGELGNTKAYDYIRKYCND